LTLGGRGLRMRELVGGGWVGASVTSECASCAPQDGLPP
jgi:predicted DNA-binding transcriptional regulator